MHATGPQRPAPPAPARRTRPPRPWTDRLRWVFLLGAVAVLVVFLIAQQQSTSTHYGAPDRTSGLPEGSSGELRDVRVPSNEQLDAELATSRVVRLPGAIATWDEQRVRAAAGRAPRILVLPPGLSKETQQRLSEVRNADVLVLGTRVSGGIYAVTPDRIAEWRTQFATGDVTGLMTTVLAATNDRPEPAGTPQPARVAPPRAELAEVTKALRDNGKYVAPGATLRDVPRSTTAFGGLQPLYVALPQQPADRPLVHFGPSLTREFPGRPILVMYGQWIEYDGPAAADFSDVAAASFYGRFGDRLSRYAYPQGNVLGAYLNRVTTVRYSGVFGRPLPYTPVDPLRVALPALPWIFAGCAIAFLALSARSVLRPPRSRLRGGAAGTVPARLAGLTTLAVELSGLARADAPAAALTRAITQLGAAREALDDDLPAAQVHRLLDTAESELDSAARLADWPDYRPRTYLQWRLV